MGQGNKLTANMNDLRGISAFDFCVNTWCIKNEAESIFTYESGETFSTFGKCDEAYKGGIEKEIEASKQNSYHPCYTAAQGNVDDIETCFTECVAAEMLGGNVNTCIKQWEASRKNSIKSSEASGSYTPDTRRDVIYEPGSGKTRMPTTTPTALPTTSPTTKKPTAAPTTSPPTKKPTVAAPTSVFNPPKICGVDTDECTNDINSCCSDYKCVGNQYYRSCELKQSATCLPRWADCTNNINGCCEGNVCLGDKYYKQCLKTATTSPQTEKPTDAPTTSPPTKKTTEAPTTSPPTKKTTAAPTTSPPTKKTTAAPTTSPPTKKPTEAPTTSPPTKNPTAAPTTSP